MVLCIVISLNQARCCEAEALCFVRLMLGDTPGAADHYAPSNHEAASGFADQTAVSAKKASHGNRYGNRYGSRCETDES
jgi:hypothetical protein